MLGDVIPHFYGRRPAADDGDGLNNLRIRIGEVQAVYGPKHDLNISKKRNEYQVFCSHRANGTAVTKMYEHCFLADGFASFADFIRFTLRADPSASQKSPGPGVGAKVLIACINGESTNPVIFAGVPDAETPVDDEEDGHHFDAVFNGLAISINKDGELTITYGGATNADGTLADGVDEDAPGTTVSITKDGNFTVADKDAKNVVTVDHTNNKIQATTTEFDVIAKTIKHGSTSASQSHVLGNKLIAWLQKLAEAIEQITVVTGTGTSSPPINIPVFQELVQELKTLISQVSFTD